MEQRAIPRAGFKVGVVGMGCEGLLGKPAEYYQAALDTMEQAGANCIDLYSPNPEMRSNLGNALSGRRDRFVLQAHLCSVWEKGQYRATRNLEETKASFADQLARLQTDYLDIGMIHYVDSDKTWQQVRDNGILAYAQDLRAKGVIRALGVSSHNPVIALRAVQEGDMDVLMFSVNPCYDLQPAGEDVEQLWNRDKYGQSLINMDPDRAKLYESCQSMGVAITVMKAFGGGDLLVAEKSLAQVALTAHEAIAYALDRPGVVCVLAGARSLEELKISLGYAQASPEMRDYAAVLATFPRISWKGHCMYCGHCAPCVAGIDIALTTKLLSLAEVRDEMPETVREHYAAMPHKADECQECGVCESRCPFDVQIRANMRRAAEVFGGK